MSIELYLDPSCPFSWVTGRWLLGAAEAAGKPAMIGSLSLALLNEGVDGIPDEFAARQASAVRVLRTMEAARTTGGDRAANILYLEAGARFHLEGDVRFGRLDEAVEAAELPNEVMSAADDAAWDARLFDGIARARRWIGDDIASPVMVFGVHERAFKGPILQSVPEPSEGRRLFDAISELAAIPSFCQIVSPMSGRPDPS